MLLSLAGVWWHRCLLPAASTSFSVSCNGGSNDLQWPSNDRVEAMRELATVEMLLFVVVVVVEEWWRVVADLASEVPASLDCQWLLHRCDRDDGCCYHLQRMWACLPDRCKGVGMIVLLLWWVIREEAGGKAEVLLWLHL